MFFCALCYLKLGLFWDFWPFNSSEYRSFMPKVVATLWFCDISSFPCNTLAHKVQRIDCVIVGRLRGCKRLFGQDCQLKSVLSKDYCLVGIVS